MTNDTLADTVQAALNDDLPAVRVERLVHSIRTELNELAEIRLDPATAHLLENEAQNLGAALTSLQVLLSHVKVCKPMLRLVR